MLRIKRRSTLNSPERTRIVWASAAAPPSGRSCPIDCTVPRRAVCAAALWYRQRSSLCGWRLVAPRPTTSRSSSPWSSDSGRSTPSISASSPVLERCLQKSGSKSEDSVSTAGLLSLNKEREVGVKSDSNVLCRFRLNNRLSAGVVSDNYVDGGFNNNWLSLIIIRYIFSPCFYRCRALNKESNLP